MLVGGILWSGERVKFSLKWLPYLILHLHNLCEKCMITHNYPYTLILFIKRHEKCLKAKVGHSDFPGK